MRAELTTDRPAPAVPADRRRRAVAMAVTPAAPGIIADSVLSRAVAILDAILVLAAYGAVALWAPLPVPPGRLLVGGAAFLYATMAALRALGSYRTQRLSGLRASLWDAGLAVTTGCAVLASVEWLVRDAADAPASWVAWAGAAAFCALATARVGLWHKLRQWGAKGRLARNVAVIGANDYSRSFVETIQSDSASRMKIVGLYDDRLNRLVPGGPVLPVQGNVASLIADARHRRIDVIVVALPLSASDRIAQIRGQLSPTVSDIFLTADTAGLRYDGRDFASLGRNGVIRVGRRALDDTDAALKAVSDWLGAAILLALLSPLLLLVAVLIRLDSPGPALFRQPRTGFNNRAFLVLKFRTMHRHMADLHADRQTTRDDARVTRLGRLLRRTSLDELPQLLNVLRGEMSLVGPRPHAVNTKAGSQFFDEVVAEYALRHRIKPGITGWAQVNGWRGETARVEQIQQRVAHDLAYIENWSIWLDLKILFLTVTRGLRGTNAY